MQFKFNCNICIIYSKQICKRVWSANEKYSSVREERCVSSKTICSRQVDYCRIMTRQTIALNFRAAPSAIREFRILLRQNSGARCATPIATNESRSRQKRIAGSIFAGASCLGQVFNLFPPGLRARGERERAYGLLFFLIRRGPSTFAGCALSSPRVHRR